MELCLSLSPGPGDSPEHAIVAGILSCAAVDIAPQQSFETSLLVSSECYFRFLRKHVEQYKFLQSHETSSVLWVPLCKLDGKSKGCCILSLCLFHIFPFTRVSRLQCDELRYSWGNIKINSSRSLVLWLTSQVRIFFARLVYIQIGKMKAWDGKTGWSHGHTIQCCVCLVFQHDCVDLAHNCAGVTNHWLARFSCFQSARCKISNSGFESWHIRLRPGSLYYAGGISKPSFISTVRPCLVPRPQYFASVIRFGSRGPGRRVWPRHKPEEWDNLFSLFHGTDWNSLNISGRGTAGEK